MKKAFVVGVGGATQSGKSTFSKELENVLSTALRVKLIHQDRYHKKREEQPVIEAPFTKKEYSDFNSLDSFDLTQFYIDIQDEISGNCYDVIIVEGTFVLYDKEILKVLDLKLFVETQADERALRYIELYSKYHGHDFIRNSYMDLVRYRMDEYIIPTKWRADILLNGSMKSEHAVEMVKTYLLKCGKSRGVTCYD